MCSIKIRRHSGSCARSKFVAIQDVLILLRKDIHCICLVLPTCSSIFFILPSRHMTQIAASLLCRNDVTTSFWRDKDVVIASCPLGTIWRREQEGCQFTDILKCVPLAENVRSLIQILRYLRPFKCMKCIRKCCTVVNLPTLIGWQWLLTYDTVQLVPIHFNGQDMALGGENCLWDSQSDVMNSIPRSTAWSISLTFGICHVATCSHSPSIQKHVQCLFVITLTS